MSDVTTGSRRKKHRQRAGLLRSSLPAASIGEPARAGLFTMPNIRQQKKRVRSAARQRLENLRYRSTVKTLTRRLRDAADEGDAEKIAAEHARARPLARQGGGARRAAPEHGGAQEGAGRAARRRRRRVASAAALGLRRLAPRDRDERALELELVRQADASLDRDVELGEPRRRRSRARPRESLGLCVSLLRTGYSFFLSLLAASRRPTRPGAAKTLHARTRPTWSAICQTRPPASDAAPGPLARRQHAASRAGPRRR